MALTIEQQHILLGAAADLHRNILSGVVSPDPDSDPIYQASIDAFNNLALSLGLEAGGITVSFADAEVPSGTVDGSNTTFTLAHTPNPSSSLELWENGLLQVQGTDYTLSSNTITMVRAPQSGVSPDTLIASYRY